MDTEHMGGENIRRYRVSPEESASCISRLFFFWFFPIMKKVGTSGSSSTVKLHSPLPGDLSQSVYTAVQGNWDRTRLQKDKKPGWRLLKCLCCTFLSWHIALLVVLGLLCAIINIVRAYLISYLAAFLTGQPWITANQAYVIGAAVVFTAFLWVIINGYLFHQILRYGMRIRTAMETLVFKSLLHMDYSALNDVGSGHIINLLSTDIETIVEAARWPCSLYDGPVTFVILVVLLWLEVGLSVLPGIGCLILFGVIGPVMLNPAFRTLRLKIATASDKRVQLMSEVIRGIAAVKTYCWEKPFGRNIAKLRKKETDRIAFLMFLNSIVLVQDVLVSVLPGMLIIVTYTCLVGDLSIFQCIRIFGLLDAGGERVSSFGLRVIQCSIAFSSIQRIEDPRFFQLVNLTFQLQKGEMLTVVGPVGAGKTTLLMTLLGQTKVRNGLVHIGRSVAYVPQEPWIYSASLRENILFGTPFIATKYFEVIRACSLEKDISLLADGDQTIIGERGVTLSGGQKARVGLARAVYQNKDIYLLDDPLSALDANVAKHIYNRCIQGILAEKTRILVTHNLTFLKDSPLISVVYQGSIMALGSYDAVKAHLTVVQSDKGIDSQDKAAPFSGEKSVQLEPVTNIPAAHSEEMMEGKVDIDVYKRFFQAGKGPLLLPLYLLCALLMVAADILRYWWLSKWSVDISRIELENKTPNKTYDIWDKHAEELVNTRHYYILVYVALMLSIPVLHIAHIEFLVLFSAMASKNLHNRMFMFVLGAKMKFFDTTPIGIILNRFSRDLGFIDLQLPEKWQYMSTYLFQVVGLLVLSSIVVPWLSVGVVMFLIGIWFIRRYSVRSGRQYKRMEALCKSPMYSHLSTTMDGLCVIQAFRKESEYFQAFQSLQNNHTSAWYMHIVNNQWTGLYIGFATTGFLAFLIIAAFVVHETLDVITGGLLGFAIMNNSTILYFVEYLVRLTMDTELIMTSVERILLYLDLQQEKSPPANIFQTFWPKWPCSGKISFQRVYLRYSKEEPYVLKNITFDIPASEKTGIIGRTGAGKSSLFRSMLRLTDCEGQILIDGVDIRQIPLDVLRSNISVIPQDPFLPSGTLRQNLDPFEEFDTCDIMQVLEKVQLKDFVMGICGQLEAQVGFGGCRFSVGQKQLICLARALLRKNKIIIVDEATANVDHRTDQFVQKTTREQFFESTVLTIAHRINTLYEADRIMILDRGELKGFYTPDELNVETQNDEKSL